MKNKEIPGIYDFIDSIAEKCQPEMSVTLSSYNWAQLLNEMRDHMLIRNRDQSTNRKLFEMIGSQLSGKPIAIILSEEPKEPKEVVPDAVSDKKWYHKMMMRS